MAEQAAEAGQAKLAGGPKKKLLILALIVLAVAAGGAGVAFVYYSPAAAATKDKPKAAKHAEEKPPVFVKLETFTVNLHDEDADRYLQIDMDLKVADPKDDELLKQRMPELRNAVLLLLSSKRSDDLRSADGKKKLGEEVRASANKLLAQVAPDAVQDVLFNSFIIQ